MRAMTVRGLLTLAAIANLGAAQAAVSLTGQIGSTVMIPLAESAGTVGFGGSETAPDLQRGEVVYWVDAPELSEPVDLVTEATFLLTPSEKSRLFDDPVSARLHQGKAVSIVRIPGDRGLAAGIAYAVRADLVRGEEVQALDFSGTLVLLPERVAILRPDVGLVEVGGPEARSHRQQRVSNWLAPRQVSTEPVGLDLGVSIPRPALQLQWSWSGGPRIDGEPAEFSDGPNKIFGVDLAMRYPSRVMDIVRVVAPTGRDLVIWHQDDGAGELLIQAVSRDGMSVNHLEVVFELDGERPLDPADPSEGIELTLRKAVDPLGAPVEGGQPGPWSLEFSPVTVR